MSTPSDAANAAGASSAVANTERMFGILTKSGEKRVVIPTSVDIEVDAINKGKPHDALYTAGLNYIHNLEGRYDVGLYVNAFITKLCLS